MKEYIHLPPEKAIPLMREALHMFLEQEGRRVSNPDGTKLPQQLFDMAHMIEYLLEVVGYLQERLGT